MVCGKREWEVIADEVDFIFSAAHGTVSCLTILGSGSEGII
jgi:hypothetical protein